MYKQLGVFLAVACSSAPSFAQERWGVPLYPPQNQPVLVAPVAPQANGPIVIVNQPPPIPPFGGNAGPWGTGYSSVTSTYSGPNIWAEYLGIEGATQTTTTSSYVPNGATGYPVVGAVGVGYWGLP